MITVFETNENVTVKKVEVSADNGLLNLVLEDGTVVNFVANGEDEFVIDISDDELEGIQTKFK